MITTRTFLWFVINHFVNSLHYLRLKFNEINLLWYFYEIFWSFRKFINFKNSHMTCWNYFVITFCRLWKYSQDLSTQETRILKWKPPSAASPWYSWWKKILSYKRRWQSVSSCKRSTYVQKRRIFLMFRNF